MLYICVLFADVYHFSELTNAISEDWGGKPFVDLRKGWQYILDNYPEVSPYAALKLLHSCDVCFKLDVDRAVAAGASWGGYAIK